MTSFPKAEPTVFIVDDDLDVRGGLTALLQSVGLKCESFASTRDFLSSKIPEVESCLILDVRLPGASGLDFQDELARSHIDITIIFITGHGDIPMSVRAMKAGAVEFLTKPVREQDILDAVNVALERDRLRRTQDDATRELRARFESLSPREREVVTLVTAGLMNKQAAGELGVSEVTVKVHRHNAMQKLGAKSVADLVRIADALRIRRN
jgi:FixJ family two-component response regulator